MAVPFREPPWLKGLPSPFYNDSHYKWQQHCRNYISEHFAKYAMEWENEQKVPEHVYATFAKSNMLIPCLPAPLPVQWLQKAGITQIGPLRIEDFDYTHTAVFLAEMSRGGLAGPVSSLITGLAYGTPPLIEFASQQLQEKVVPDLLLGRKRICIAITETDAGSDVARLATSAEKTSDGKHYIINGSKKWITNGLWSDYASTCVRTGGEGPTGLSLLLVPLKGVEGVSIRRLHVSGRKSSGTSFIDFEDVKVPVENLIGEEGMGMKYLMVSFQVNNSFVLC